MSMICLAVDDCGGFAGGCVVAILGTLGIPRFPSMFMSICLGAGLYMRLSGGVFPFTAGVCTKQISFEVYEATACTQPIPW